MVNPTRGMNSALPPISPNHTRRFVATLTDDSFPLSCFIVRAVVRFFTVLVLVFSLGLHWALLQTIAWTGMIVSYSQDASLKEALAKTFDGKHPCCLCKVVQQGRTDEKKQEQQQVNPDSKLILGLVWQTITFNFDCDRGQIPSCDSAAPSRREEPPKPRPRTVSLDSLA